MSRSAAHRPSPEPADRLQQGLSAFWPTACILSVATGCTFGPIETVPINQPPEIVTSNVPLQSTLTIEKDDQRVFVVVEDDDESELQAIWYLSLDGEIHDVRTSLEPFRSEISLDREEALDGQTLTVSVRDGVYEAQAWWTLEVLR